jgi:hypothetical protein
MLPMTAKLQPASIGDTPDGNQQDELTGSTNHPAKLQKKTIQAIQMVNAGIDPADALKMVNFKQTISAKQVCELKNKVKKHSLTEPSLVRSAQSQIKRILKNRARAEAHKKVTKDGQVVEYTDNIYPTDSNIIAAASMVYDRYEPAQSREQGGETNLTYIDLRGYILPDRATIEGNSLQEPVDMVGNGRSVATQAIDITTDDKKDVT